MMNTEPYNCPPEAGAIQAEDDERCGLRDLGIIIAGAVLFGAIVGAAVRGAWVG